MDAVSPFFATTRLLNEIRSVRARREESQTETHTKSEARDDAAPQKPRRTPK